MAQDVKKFSITGALCFDDDDRTLIQRNIKTFLLEFGLIPQGSDNDKAMQTFNHMVRSRLPHFLTRSMGRFGLRWHYVVILAATGELPLAMDRLAAQVWDHSLRFNALVLVEALLRAIFTRPCWFAIESTMVRLCLALPSKFHRVIALIITFPVSAALLVGMYASSMGIVTMATEGSEKAEGKGGGAGEGTDVNNYWLFMFISNHTMVALCTLLLYHPNIALARTFFSEDSMEKDEYDEDTCKPAALGNTALQDSADSTLRGAGHRPEPMGTHSFPHKVDAPRFKVSV